MEKMIGKVFHDRATAASLYGGYIQALTQVRDEINYKIEEAQKMLEEQLKELDSTPKLIRRIGTPKRRK